MSDDEVQAIFDVVADSGREVAETGVPRGVSDARAPVDYARDMRAERFIDELDRTPLLSPELESLVQHLEEVPAGGGVSVRRLRPLDQDGMRGFVRNLADEDGLLMDLPELEDTIRVIERRIVDGEPLRYQEVLDDMATRGISRSLARRILTDYWP